MKPTKRKSRKYVRKKNDDKTVSEPLELNLNPLTKNTHARKHEQNHFSLMRT